MQGSEALDLKQFLGVFRRSAPLVVVCVIALAGAAYAFSKRETKKYTATASVAFNNNSLAQEIAGLPASGGVSLLTEQANELELLKRGDMAAKSAAQLGRGLTEQKISESVSVAGQGESGVIDVSATSTSPVLAADIANTYSRQFVEEQKSTNAAYFQSALKLVHKELAALSSKQREGADGAQLQDRGQTLSLLSNLKEGNVQVAAEAQAPTSPSSPKTSRNALFGGVLGLLIGLALALLLQQDRGRIGSPRELETIYHLPLLGSVPRSRALARPGTALPMAEAEAFSLIRAYLRLLSKHRDLHTVMIVSAAEGDGKTTIARGLAEAAAWSGSRAMLLEMDLRHPVLAGQFNIQSESGVVDVLTGAARLDEATRPVALKATSPGPSGSASERSFDVLVAGAAQPSNPSELLEGQAMEALLEHARSAYDLVVIDTPPLTGVSDAFALLTKVDGVIVVGRVEHSRRDAAERLSQILSNSGVSLLGVIANDSKSGGPGVYHRDGESSPVVVSTSGTSESEQLVPPARV